MPKGLPRLGSPSGRFVRFVCVFLGVFWGGFWCFFDPAPWDFSLVLGFLSRNYVCFWVVFGVFFLTFRQPGVVFRVVLVHAGFVFRGFGVLCFLSDWSTVLAPRCLGCFLLDFVVSY